MHVLVHVLVLVLVLGAWALGPHRRRRLGEIRCIAVRIRDVQTTVSALDENVHEHEHVHVYVYVGSRTCTWIVDRGDGDGLIN